jgi:6-phosphogluconolactonase (cycloisomerase 2 family)
MAVNIIGQYMKKFKFSPTGKYFVIAANIESDTIHIYDSSNIEILLPEKVEKGEYLSELSDPDIKEM